MSKNIAIIPLIHDMYSTKNSLLFDRSDYDKYIELDKIAKPINKLVIDGEFPSEARTEDYYGDPLKTITIKQFLKIYEVPDLDWWDKKIIALLKCCKPSDRILLWYV